MGDAPRYCLPYVTMEGPISGLNIAAHTGRSDRANWFDDEQPDGTYQNTMLPRATAIFSRSAATRRLLPLSHYSQSSDTLD